MVKFFIFCAFFLFFPLDFFPEEDHFLLNVADQKTIIGGEDVALFSSVCQEEHLQAEAFKSALAGYRSLSEVRQKEVLTLIDFTLPSTEKRLFVFDMKQLKLLYSSYVAHGKCSGGNYASDFSNDKESYKSSLGFYLTENSYQGSNGYSLILNGLEKGINDKAKERAIVMHGADYCDPSLLRSAGRLGRSLGCPALPRAITRQIIDAIKGGSLLYIYANQPEYFKKSSVLK